ncbi:MAG: hypothetical protein JNL57_13215 [Bacteroidetes bacterium]|nr:hypothetical protein [Bacteroidota bacterium]
MTNKVRRILPGFTALLMILPLLTCIESCKKKETTSDQPRVTITGRINRQSPVRRGDTPTLADAAKVLVFKGVSIKRAEEFVSAEVVSINNDSFSFSTAIGNATALVFITSNNKFIGNLNVQGLNVLPLGKLRDGERAVINLSELQLVGTSVIPAHDPLGNEIIITPEELASLQEQDSYFEAMVQNLDADNDGIIDWTQQQDKFITTRIEVIGGKYGIGSTLPVLSDTQSKWVGYLVQIWARGAWTADQLKGSKLNGPENNPHNDIQYQGWREGMEFYRPPLNPQVGVINTFRPYSKGKYNLILDGKNYNFIYSTTLNISKLVVPVPTLRTNVNGLITGISLAYKTNNGQSIAPEHLITWVSAVVNHKPRNMNGKTLAALPSMFVYDPNRIKDPKAPKENFGWYKVGIEGGDFATPLDLSLYDPSEIQVVCSCYDMMGNKYDYFWLN